MCNIKRSDDLFGASKRHEDRGRDGLARVAESREAKRDVSCHIIGGRFYSLTAC